MRDEALTVLLSPSCLAFDFIFSPLFSPPHHGLGYCTGETGQAVHGYAQLHAAVCSVPEGAEGGEGGPGARKGDWPRELSGILKRPAGERNGAGEQT